MRFNRDQRQRRGNRRQDGPRNRQRGGRFDDKRDGDRQNDSGRFRRIRKGRGDRDRN